MQEEMGTWWWESSIPYNIIRMIAHPGDNVWTFTMLSPCVLLWKRVQSNGPRVMGIMHGSSASEGV